MSFKPLKIQNPFKREHMPDHMREEQLAHVRWRNNAIAAMAVSAVLAGLLTPVLWYAATHPFRIQTWNGIASFFSLVFQGKLLHIHLLFAQSFGPGVFSVIGGTLLAYCSCMFIAILPGGIAALFNPHQNLAFKQGQASWADEEALQAMEKRQQVGIKGGFLMALGRWPSGKRKGQMVQMIETLSCLCLAPPGTGKTAGLVVPTLVSSDNVSFIVNDPKPELWEFTSSYRSEVSHVFMLNWSKTDEPNFVVRFYKGRNKPFWDNLRRFHNPEDEAPLEVANALRARADEYEVKLEENAFKRLRAWLHANDAADVITYDEPVFFPRFNFLSPRLVPPVGPDRDTYLDAIAKTLIPDDNKGGDSYFKNKGRAALTGFFHMLVAKVGDAKDFSGIPANWVGKEPSIPMLSDWMAISQFNATGGKGTEPVDAMTEIVDEDEADQNPNQDKMGEWIRKVSASIQPRPEFSPTSPENLGKSERGFMELVQLVNMADKERSGVLGTMDEALLPFKNAAVKERTSACDFTPDDMRGILNPEIQVRTKLDPNDPNYLDRNSNEFRSLQADKANWRPVTLYICVNQAEAKAFSNITALLYQVLSRDLLSYGPKEMNEKTKTQLGPFPVCFMLDEFAKLPKIDAVIEGPDLGRSKKTSYALVAQDFSQIEKAYTKEDVEIITSTTGVKHILPQNNPNTVERIQKMVGQTTIKDRNKSGTEGFSKQANPLAANVSEQTSGVNFLRTEDIAALSPGKNIVIVQGFSNKPMMLDTPMYFQDKALSERVFPGYSRIGPDGKHKRLPNPRFYLPRQIFDARQIEHREFVRSAQATAIREDQERLQMSAFVGGEEVDIHPQRFS